MCIGGALVLWNGACARSTHPSPFTDRQFWELITSFSEAPGTFTLSDNFVSNEPRVAENARWLRPAGGVYVGENRRETKSTRSDDSSAISAAPTRSVE